MVAKSVIVEVDQEKGAQKRCLGRQVQGHWEGDGELVLQPEAAQGTNLLRILNEYWLIFKMQMLLFFFTSGPLSAQEIVNSSPSLIRQGWHQASL